MTDRTVFGIVAAAMLAAGCLAVEPDHHDPHNATGAWWQLRNVTPPTASEATALAAASRPAATVSNSLKIEDENGHIHGRLTIRGDTTTPTDPWDAVVRGDRIGLDMIIEYHHPGMGQCQYDGNLDSNGYNYTGVRYCAPEWDTVETFALFRTPMALASGYVRLDNEPLDSVSLVLTMSGTGFERDTITSADGSYAFYDVPADKYRNYTLTADLPTVVDGAHWRSSSVRRLAIRDGTAKRIDFLGVYIRTASLIGTVTGNNSGLADVTVALTGVDIDTTKTTDKSGLYAHLGLRAGTYVIAISGFDTTKWAFPYTDTTAVIGTGESRVVSFSGTAK